MQKRHNLPQKDELRKIYFEMISKKKKNQNQKSKDSYSHLQIKN